MPLKGVPVAGKLLVVPLVLLAVACPARAQLACSVTNSGVSFGRYDGTSRVPDDASGSITVVCTAHTPATFAYSIGLVGTEGSATARVMRFSARRLTYQLYRDPARTELWGDGAGQTASFAASLAAGHASVQHFTVYGRIPPGQNIPPGTYQDQVVVAITY